MAIPVLCQNPTTPVSPHRLDRRPPRCVSPYSAFGQPAIAPTTPQKQIPESPPMAPQTPLRCTHSGGAPALTAHMSLLYGYPSSTQLADRRPCPAARHIEPAVFKSNCVSFFRVLPWHSVVKKSKHNGSAGASPSHTLPPSRVRCSSPKKTCDSFCVESKFPADSL
jgi:hypothetical protein